MYSECQNLEGSQYFGCKIKSLLEIVCKCTCRDKDGIFTTSVWKADVKGEFKNWVDPKGPSAKHIEGNWNTSFGKPNIRNFYRFCSSQEGNWENNCQLQTLDLPETLYCLCSNFDLNEDQILIFDIEDIWPKKKFTTVPMTTLRTIATTISTINSTTISTTNSTTISTTNSTTIPMSSSEDFITQTSDENFSSTVQKSGFIMGLIIFLVLFLIILIIFLIIQCKKRIFKFMRLQSGRYDTENPIEL